MVAMLSDDKPIYLQVKEYLMGEILNGAYSDDEQIPSTNELASFFSINPITVLKGVTMLSEEGIIYKKRGIGMFVSTGARKLIQEQYRQDFVEKDMESFVQKTKALRFSKKELFNLIEQRWNTPSPNETSPKEKDKNNG